MCCGHWMRTGLRSCARGSLSPRASVDVKVPLGLLKAGLKLTSVIPPRAMDQINESMSQSGMSIDFDNLKPEDIEAIVNELREVEVTVEDKNGNHVRGWCA